uniref:SET domain-containing protein n=1 Tax=Gouania willdenowi TaxID=441366 RepID=A0A8C5DR13_GOUWI
SGWGCVVVATRRFQVGEVICDYHGRAITAKEGKEIHVNTSEEETGYMFFYKDKRGRCMCMDAQKEYCECHPEMQTVGRHINHAGEGANLKTRLYTVDIDGEEKDVILFIASKHIKVNEELLFDYGNEWVLGIILYIIHNPPSTHSTNGLAMVGCPHRHSCARL